MLSFRCFYPYISIKNFYVNARGKSEDKSAPFVDVIKHLVCLFELKVFCLYREKGLCFANKNIVQVAVYIKVHLALIAFFIRALRSFYFLHT